MDWYALQVRSNHERVVRAALEFQAIEDFDPVYLEKHRWSDRNKVIPRHLFPGYLFARFDPYAQTRRAVLSVPGVLRIVGLGLDPVPIPDSEIASIRLMLESPHPVLACDPAVGDTVTVARGPLFGCAGTVIREKQGKLRLVVSIQMLGRAASVEISTEDLQIQTRAARA